jgi:hypothetical protein
MVLQTNDRDTYHRDYNYTNKSTHRLGALINNDFEWDHLIINFESCRSLGHSSGDRDDFLTIWILSELHGLPILCTYECSRSGITSGEPVSVPTTTKGMVHPSVTIAVGFDIFPIEIVTGRCVAILSRQVFRILHPALTSEVVVPLMSGVIQPRKATQVSIVLRQGVEVQFDDVDVAHSAVVTVQCLYCMAEGWKMMRELRMRLKKSSRGL